MSRLPFSDASMSGVSLKRFGRFGSAFAESSTSIDRALPLRAAMQSGVSPFASTELGSMPRPMSLRTSSGRSFATATASSSRRPCAATPIGAQPINMASATGANARSMRIARNPEQVEEIPRCRFSNRLDRNLAQACDLTGNMGDERRLVALAAIRHRRKIRTVGFDQHPVERHALRNILHRGGVLERHDAGERDVETKVERLRGDVPRLSKAMHDAAGISGALVTHDRQRVDGRGARVDHQRLLRRACRANVRAKSIALPFEIACQAKVVEPRLAN